MKTVAAVLFILSASTGSCAMATDLNLHWEWPAGRQPQHKLVMVVTDIKADSGSFGIRRSPSTLEGYPDPIKLTGTLVKEKGGEQGKSVVLVMPKLEADGFAKGDYIAIGILGNDTCICAKRVQSADDDVSDWHC